MGRGVLLDVYRWAHEAFDLFYIASDHGLGPLVVCESIRRDVRTGNILLVRTGWVKQYSMWPARLQKQALADLPGAMDHRYAGLDALPEMLDFLHDHYFAAAVTDTICFEIWPPNRLVSERDAQPLAKAVREYEILLPLTRNSPSLSAMSLHVYLLPLWGMLIGELWDMEALAENAAERTAGRSWASAAQPTFPVREAPSSGTYLQRFRVQ